MRTFFSTTTITPFHIPEFIFEKRYKLFGSFSPYRFHVDQGISFEPQDIKAVCLIEPFFDIEKNAAIPISKPAVAAIVYAAGISELNFSNKFSRERLTAALKHLILQVARRNQISPASNAHTRG